MILYLGRPFSTECAGTGIGIVSETVEKFISAANVVFSQQPCQLCINMPGTVFRHHLLHIISKKVYDGKISTFFFINFTGAVAMDLSAKLTTPSYVTDDVKLMALDDVTFAVNFIPKELGLHTISVLYRGTHISGD